MALNSLLFYQFFVYISTKFDGGHNSESGKKTPQLHGILGHSVAFRKNPDSDTIKSTRYIDFYISVIT